MVFPKILKNYVDEMGKHLWVGFKINCILSSNSRATLLAKTPFLCLLIGVPTTAYFNLVIPIKMCFLHCSPDR